MNTKTIDWLNIGLMGLSLGLAYVLPFELFLFSYAVLGPLHYLTEIGWLHKRDYFLPDQKAAKLFLPSIVVLGILLVWSAFGTEWLPDFSGLSLGGWGANIILGSLLLAGILVFIKSPVYRVLAAGMIGICLLVFQIERPATVVRIEGEEVARAMEWKENPYILVRGMQVQRENGSLEPDFGVLFQRGFEGLNPVGYTLVKSGFSLIPPKGCSIANARGFVISYGKSPEISFEGSLTQFALFVAVFLPTLIHVFVFTGLFMAFGAVKSKSKPGWLAVGVLLLCGIIPFVWYPSLNTTEISSYVEESYRSSFFEVNRQFLNWFGGLKAGNQASADVAVFSSTLGVGLMRFIAFAYTYHYLNWFSKTSLIQWHKMPKITLLIIGLVWIASLILYGFSYKTGLKALFLLSFLHVFLEFPLNFASIKGLAGTLSVSMGRKSK
jgi:hypothetical protein